MTCDGNQLKNLDVSANIELVDLSCFGNQLTALDVSANINLKKLICNFNQLKSLNACSLGKGSFLYATNKPSITSIQVNDVAYAIDNWSNAIDPGAIFSACIVGTEVNLTHAEIAVFPNPNNGIFTISGLPAEEITIEVYIMAGEKVYSVTSRETSHRVDISGCTKGIHVVNISNGKNVFTHKVDIR